MKRVLFICFVLISILCNAQRKYAADRYFNEFAYKKSAELYEVIYEKGDDSQLVLSRLGDSYYFNTQPKEAEKWYKILLEKYSGEVAPEYLFRYAQSLKSNGKVKESDLWLTKLKEVDDDDSRALELENNRNYFVEYSNRKKTYVNVKNLSTNTEYSDFGGFIYNDQLYFASTKPVGSKFDNKVYKWNDQPFLNIYVADEDIGDVEEGLQVSNAIKLDIVNTRYHESNVILSKDGNTMYFTRDNYDGEKLKGDDDRVTHLKIYKADKVDGEWKNFKELPFNNDDYSCGHPALSSDGKTLYFVSDMPGGFGATDIYSVSISGDGNYGTPKNLGKTINTESREMFPYVDEENTMYFASDGHLGLGALDVFESKISGTNFTAPVNLGSPVNSPLDDFSFVISNDKSYGYFSSNRAGGKGDDDIYSFVIYKCKEDISGVVTDSRTGEPINGATVLLVNEKGEPVSQKITESNGRYVFEDIACENNYTVTASKDDYRNDKKDTATEDIDKKIIKADLVLESLIVETPQEEPQIVIKPIYFDFDLYNIRKDAEYELEHIVSVMKNHPDMVIRIESHTDSRGTKAYNRILSTNRAKSTRDYIISRGIAAERIESAKGFGEDMLLNNCNDANQKNCSKEEHQRNRRSYFYIVRGGKNITSKNQ